MTETQCSVAAMIINTAINIGISKQSLIAHQASLLIIFACFAINITGVDLKPEEI